MTDPFVALQALLQPGPLQQTAFPPTSRYHGLATATIDVDGRTVVFVRRRFVPPPESLALLTTHVVAHGERLDHLAARYLGDPEQFWRICDANRAMRPEELVATVGRRLRITLPEGLWGTPDA